MWVTIFCIVILLILSGFFSGSETALTAASPAFMHDKEKEEDDDRAKKFNKLNKNQEKLLGSILLGNNLVNILATSLSTSVLIGFFGKSGVAYATIIMTILVLIFSEILPKTYAIRNANRVALNVSPAISFAVTIFTPFVFVLQWIVKTTLKLFKIDDLSIVTRDALISELRGTIRMQDSKKIKQEKDMLKSVLDLENLDVYDVMNHRKNLFSVDIDLPIEEIVEKLTNSPYSRVPLWREKPENIVGVLRTRTLLQTAVECKGDYSKLDLKEIVNDPWFIIETTSLKDQLQAFRTKREHFAIVVDEYGVLQGIVTLEDVLEEIVGDINDETDIMQSVDVIGIKSEEDGYYIIDGQVTLRDLNRKLDWDIDDEYVATVAGYIIYCAETIPAVGQKFVFDKYEFEILQRKRNQITTVKATKLKEGN